MGSTRLTGIALASAVQFSGCMVRTSPTLEVTRLQTFGTFLSATSSAPIRGLVPKPLHLQWLAQTHK